MDSEKKIKVEKYISKNEQEKWYWKIAETVAIWHESKKKQKKSFWINGWKMTRAY
jgi:hypothetical protein